MGELTDFLVWLNRQKKAGKIPVQTVQVIGFEVLKYLQEQEEQDCTQEATEHE